MNEATSVIGTLEHHGFPAQYVLNNTDQGTVTWFEHYPTAVTAQQHFNGVILNTDQCPRNVIDTALRQARKNMLKPSKN